MSKHLPNLITILRIFGTVCLLFVEPLSGLFFVIYFLTGVTDVLDGYIARKTNFTSELGAKLDSAADLMFYAAMLIRIFPVLWERLPIWLWCMIAVVVFLRICSYTLAAVKYHRFASLHTYWNKATGAAVFAVPFFIISPFPVPFCTVVCVIAMISTLKELQIHICSKEYDDYRTTRIE